jgi:hypothetical protein
VEGVALVVDPRTSSIDGVIVDEAGGPLVDVRVRASGAGIDHDPWVAVPTTVTGADGRFHFDHLPPGDYDLLAEGAGRSASQVVTAGAASAVVTLTRQVCNASAGVPEVSHALTSPAVVWDDRIELLGWDMPTSARVGQPFEVTLVFRARSPIVYPWRAFAHFDSDHAGHRRNADHTPVGDACGTSTWKPGEVYVDRFTTTLAFPETFTLRIGFFRYGDGDEPMQNLAGDGIGIDGFEVGTVAVGSGE